MWLGGRIHGSLLWLWVGGWVRQRSRVSGFKAPPHLFLPPSEEIFRGLVVLRGGEGTGRGSKLWVSQGQRWGRSSCPISHFSQHPLPVLPTTLEQISTPICGDELHPPPRPPEASQSGGLWWKRDLYTEAAGRATPAQWLEESAPPGWAEPAPLRLGAVRRWKRRGEKAEGCANGPRGGPARQAGAGTGEPVVRPPYPPRSREPPRVGSSLTAGCKSG